MMMTTTSIRCRRLLLALAALLLSRSPMPVGANPNSNPNPNPTEDQDQAQGRRAGWFTSTGEALDGSTDATSSSSSSTTTLNFPPPGFSPERHEQKQHLAELKKCLFEESHPMVVMVEAGVVLLQEPLVVDGCWLDCGTKTLQSTVKSAPIVAIRNGGRVANCKVALITDEDLDNDMDLVDQQDGIESDYESDHHDTLSQTSPPSWSSSVLPTDVDAPTSTLTYWFTTASGFLCDKGDCFLEQITCTALPINGAARVPLLSACVLVRPGAGTVHIIGTNTNINTNTNTGLSEEEAVTLVTKVGAGDQQRIVSAYGIVVDAGPNPAVKHTSDDEGNKYAGFRYYRPSETENLTKTKLFLDRVWIQYQVYNGIKIFGGVNTVRITDSVVSYNGNVGIEVDQGDGLRVFAVLGGVVEHNVGNGIQLKAYEPYRLYSGSGSDGKDKDKTNNGRNDETARWTRPEFLIADAKVFRNGKDGLHVRGNRIREVVLDGAVFERNALNGIDVRSAKTVTVHLQGVVSNWNARNGLAVEAYGAEVQIKNSLFAKNGRDKKDAFETIHGGFKRAGIYLSFANSVTITNSAANGNGHDGIFIHDSADISLEGVDANHNGDIGINIREANAAYGYDYTANTNYLIGAYYYPWHGTNFHGGNYLRNQLKPPQHPTLGEYNDSDPDVIAQHMEWFRKSNIGLLVTSWWGPDRIEDSNTKDVLLQHDHIGNLKIALHYETTGRINEDDENMSVPRQDMQYICENYFDHPNYYKINDRPVMVIYISRKLEQLGILEKALLVMKSEANKCGFSPYFIGDAVFAKAPNSDEPVVSFVYFDAVTNYDVYGSSGASKRSNPYATARQVDAYYEEQAKWRKLALEQNCRFVPPVSPGYNDRGVRFEKDHPPLSRKLENGDTEEGSLFRYQLEKALPLVDPAVDNLILVNSFNEWHEDTQIEPVLSEDNGPAIEPESLTSGLEYVGYEDLYLDVLRNMTNRAAGGNTNDKIYEPSRVNLSDVHSCKNGQAGLSFYITDNNRNDDEKKDLGEVSFTPGPGVVSCNNERFDYLFHGGGTIDYWASASWHEPASLLTGKNCANGTGRRRCEGIELVQCSSETCLHRPILTRSGTKLNEHNDQ